MQLVAGSQRVLDGVLVVRSMEVEDIDTLGLQSLQRGVQLRADALWLQRLAVPGIGLGGDFNCRVVTKILDAQHLPTRHVETAMPIPRDPAGTCF